MDRITALGTQLVETHGRLLDAIDDLRDGRVPPAGLAGHCLAFCAAVTRHHTGEDRTVFPALAALHPELAEVLDGLRHDHDMIATLLQQATAVAESARTASGPDDTARIRRELDGLAAILESHFTWEERRLVAALDGIDPAAAARLAAAFVV